MDDAVSRRNQQFFHQLAPLADALNHIAATSPGVQVGPTRSAERLGAAQDKRARKQARALEQARRSGALT